MIQLAKLSGFSPIIATASLRNAEHLKAQGATHVLDRNLSVDALRAEAAKITSAPLDLIYDAVSLPETQNAAYALLASGGQLVMTAPQIMLQIPKEVLRPDKAVKHAPSTSDLSFNAAAALSLHRSLPALLAEHAIKVRRVEFSLPTQSVRANADWL